MGECGCGEMTNYDAYKIGDYILAIEKYLGCEYCHTGLMVSLHLFTEENADIFFIETDKEFKTDKFGYAQLNFPIIGPEELVKAVRQIKLGGVDLSQYEDLEDIFEDVGLELLRTGTELLENQKPGKESQD